LKKLYYDKMETREYYKTLVRAFKSPEFKVRVHCVYLNVSCW